MSILNGGRRGGPLAAALAIAAVVASACAGPGHDASTDSAAVIALPPVDSSRGAMTPGTRDSMPNANAATTSPMPNGTPPKKRPEPMPTAVPKTPTPPAPKSPPRRVVPDPVLPPPESASTARTGGARDSLHDLPSDYGARPPERRRPLPPIKP